MHRLMLLLVPALFISPARDAPVACQLMTLDDVRAALGATWTASPGSLNTNTDKMTTCYYQNGVGNIVAFSMVYPPQGDAKASLAKQQKSYAVKHVVTPYADVCEGAFAWKITETNTTLIAAKGTWMVQIQVMVEKKPDVEAEKTLAGKVCSKLST